MLAEPFVPPREAHHTQANWVPRVGRQVDRLEAMGLVKHSLSNFKNLSEA